MAHCFPWPDREGETANIQTVVQYDDGDMVLIPDPGRGIIVQPANLSVHSLDRLIAGVLTLADYHRNNADRLDETAQRLTLMRPVVRSPI